MSKQPENIVCADCQAKGMNYTTPEMLEDLMKYNHPQKVAAHFLQAWGCKWISAEDSQLCAFVLSEHLFNSNE